jgi:hypothetical protein
MATVQTTIGETIQDAASLLPFEYPAITPRGMAAQLPLIARNVNAPFDGSPLKKQKTETAAALLASSGSCSQPVPASTHCSVGVTGEKLIWSGAGSLASACNCLAVLKQVQPMFRVLSRALQFAIARVGLVQFRLANSSLPPPPRSHSQRAYLTREQYDTAVEHMQSGDAAAVGLWSSFESRGFADFLSFLQPLQV